MHKYIHRFNPMHKFADFLDYRPFSPSNSAIWGASLGGLGGGVLGALDGLSGTRSGTPERKKAITNRALIGALAGAGLGGAGGGLLGTLVRDHAMAEYAKTPETADPSGAESLLDHDLQGTRPDVVLNLIRQKRFLDAARTSHGDNDRILRQGLRDMTSKTLESVTLPLPRMLPALWSPEGAAEAFRERNPTLNAPNDAAELTKRIK